MDATPRHVLIFGATGTAGQGAVRALLAAGHRVSALVRPGREDTLPHGVKTVTGDLSRDSLARAFDGGPDVVMSCLASRSGRAQDAWAIDHAAHLDILTAAHTAGVAQFIYLSAICVQKPRLAFQKAKLAFEAALQSSGMTYSIVRPTAFFKSLSGQVARVQAGRPFLVFGDGCGTACKPISDDDLGRYLAGCIPDPHRHNAVLPIGGPGPAITPLDQAAALSDLLGYQVKVKHVPFAMMGAIAGALGLLGRVNAAAAAKAELAAIGQYYARESMLVWDAQAQVYDADSTPEFGTETLFAYYEALIRGDATVTLGEHSVF
ncbi:MAG: NAD(P)H-binding protein [Roseovarius sp.]